VLLRETVVELSPLGGRCRRLKVNAALSIICFLEVAGQILRMFPRKRATRGDGFLASADPAA